MDMKGEYRDCNVNSNLLLYIIDTNLILKLISTIIILEFEPGY